MKQIQLFIIMFLSISPLCSGDSWAEHCTVGDHAFWVSFIVYFLLFFIRMFNRKSLKLIKYILSLFMIMMFSALLSQCIFFSNVLDTFMGKSVFIVVLAIAIDTVYSLSKLEDEEN